VALRTTIAARIREARERLGLTQRDLAERAGFAHHQTVSQIESGVREVKAWELANLARVLHVAIEDLLRAVPLAEPLVLWRQRPDAEDVRREQEARFHRRCARYAFLRQLAGTRPVAALPAPAQPLADLRFEDVEAFAEAVGGMLGLGDYPAESLARAAEDRWGVQIWYEDLGRDGSAAAMVADCGPAVLLNAAEAPWRRVFSLAHELFHLLTWDPVEVTRLADDEVGRRRAEQLANVFASALLLPADAVRRALLRRDRGDGLHPAEVAGLAGEFGVSTPAMLWRLVNLGALPREGAERLARDPGLPSAPVTARWGRPAPLPAEYVRLAYLAHARGDLAKAQLAVYLEVPLVDVEETLAAYGLSLRESWPAGGAASPRAAADESLPDTVGL